MTQGKRVTLYDGMKVETLIARLQQLDGDMTLRLNTHTTEVLYDARHNLNTASLLFLT